MVGLGASTQDIFPSISEKVMRTGTQTRRPTSLNKRLSQLCEKHCAKQQAKCPLSRSPEKEQVDGFLSQTGRREVLFRARMRQIGRVQLEARAKRHGNEKRWLRKRHGYENAWFPNLLFAVPALVFGSIVGAVDW
jgi:hypothetical protein